MEQRTTRIFGYDLIKTIAIFLIVFYHLGGVDYGEVVPGEYYLPNLAKFFSGFIAASVPLFLMVNGALIIPRKWTFHQAAIHSARLILLYIFWKLLLQELLCKGVFGIEEEMVHFWFLRTLAIIYLLVPFLAKYPICRKVFLVLLLIFPFLSNFIGDLVAFFSPETQLPFYAHTGLFTLYSILYFYLGWMLEDIRWQSWKNFFVIILGLLLVNFEVMAMSNEIGIVYDGINAAFPTFGALFISVGFYQILKGVVPTFTAIRQVVTFTGKNTLGVFIFHVPIIFFFRDYFSQCESNIDIIISVVLVLLLSFISYFIRKSFFRMLLII